MPSRLAALLALAAWGIAHAGAIPPPVLPRAVNPFEASARTADRIAALIADLDSDDLATRDAAANTLAEDPAATLTVLETALQSASLSPEQRSRLDGLAFARFRAEPRGAMGVSFSGLAGPDGVELSGTVGGFDAARHLRAGDVIRAMDGIPVRVNNDARAVILSHDPGDEITVEFLRQGEVRVVTLRLGHFAELRNAADPDDWTLASAWEVRARRRAAGSPAAPELATGLTPERYAAMARRSDRRSLDEKPEPTHALRPGGAARPVPEADPRFLLAGAGEDDPHIVGLRRQIEELTLRVRRGEQSLRAQNDPNRRRQLEAQLNAERRTRDALVQRLQDLVRARLRNP